MTKFSGITPNTSPALTDSAVGVTSGNVDSRFTLQSILNLFKANILTIFTNRQNDTVNTTETAAKIQTGWGYIQNNTGSAAISKAVTFPVAFSGTPILLISLAADNSTNGGYGTGGNTVEGKLSIKSAGQSSTGFTAWIHTSAGTNFAAGYTYFTWIAIGP